MNLKRLLADDDAVSPVIGVILMVAITVILAAVIATFVLGLGEQIQQTSPNVSFSFDYVEASGSIPTEDSWGSTPSNADGNLTVTHAGGPNVDASQLYLQGSSRGGGYVGDDKDWVYTKGSTNDPQYSQGDEISAGDSIVLGVASGDEIKVTWQNEEGTQSAVLQTYNVP